METFPYRNMKSKTRTTRNGTVFAAGMFAMSMVMLNALGLTQRCSIIVSNFRTGKEWCMITQEQAKDLPYIDGDFLRKREIANDESPDPILSKISYRVASRSSIRP